MSAEIFDAALRDLPEIADVLDRMHACAREAVDEHLLELCERRIALLLGSTTAEWDPTLVRTPAEEACVGFTEEFVIDVANLSDASAAAVIEYLGEQGFADFLNALLVVEQRIRMTLAWSRVLEGAAS